MPLLGVRAARHEREVLALDLPGAQSSPSSAAWASSDFATTSRPDVSRSSRCTMPGALGIGAAGGPAAQGLGEGRPVCPGAGWVTSPAGLSTTSRSSSS